MRQEEDLSEFLGSVRDRVVGRGGSQEKLFILLTNQFPLTLLHGVPRFPFGRSSLSPFSMRENLNPCEPVPVILADGADFELRLRFSMSGGVQTSFLSRLVHFEHDDDGERRLLGSQGRGRDEMGLGTDVS